MVLLAVSGRFAWSQVSGAMGLTYPVVGVTPGPQYAQMINNDLSIIEGHNHTTGSGVQVPTAGLNINGPLTFNSYDATTLRSVKLAYDSTLPISSSDLQALWIDSFGNLWYNNASGTSIQLTPIATQSNGFVGLPSANAEAAYSSGIQTFEYYANTSGPVWAASWSGPVTIYDTTSGVTNGVTLQSPTSLSPGYSITLPSGTPSSGKNVAVLMNSSGVLSTSNSAYTSLNLGVAAPSTPLAVVAANSTGALSTAQLTGSQLSVTLPGTTLPLQVSSAGALTAATISQAQRAAATIANPQTGTSAELTSPGAATNITGLAATLSGSGRPFLVHVQTIGQSSSGNASGNWAMTADTSAVIGYVYLVVTDPASAVTRVAYTEFFGGTTSDSFTWPLPTVSAVVVPTGGAGTYTIQAVWQLFSGTGSPTFSVTNATIVAVEF